MALGLLFFSCQKQLDAPANRIEGDRITAPSSVAIALDETCGTPLVKQLLDYGDLNPYGSATITNDETNLYVTLEANAGYHITRVAINYGDAADLMTTLGSGSLVYTPCNGPLNPSDILETGLNVTSKTYIIPLSSLPPDCLELSIFATIVPDGGGITRCTYAETENEWYGSVAYQATFDYCLQECPPDEECGPGRTQTPGGWGAKPEGNNPGTYLHANFETVFGQISVGCEPGYSVTLTTAQAITNLLPTGGTPAVLTMDYTDPASIKNVLVGHLVAITLAVGFDAADEDFGEGDLDLGNMVIATGTFAGKTVSEFLAIANDVLGGCSTAYTPSQIQTTANLINENYVDGKVDNGFLVCPTE